MQAAEALFFGDSEIVARMRSHDWTQTPLGSVAHWSAGLKTALSFLCSSSYPMFLVWGADRLLFYNDAFTAILPADSLALPVGQSVYDTWNSGWETMRSIVEQVFTTGQPRQQHWVPAASDRPAAEPSGKPAYTWFYSAIWDEPAQIGGVLAMGHKRLPAVMNTHTCSAECQQTEAALQQSEERYRYLAELIPQLVWTADAEGRLQDVNQRWMDFTGFSLAQAQTEGWEAIVHPEDVPTLSQNWAAAQHNGTYYQAEGRMRHVDGGYRWHLHQAVPFKNAQGHIVKWFGSATDIEDKKQLEQQLDRLLQRERAAREAAETANRIKDEFLAVLSHELRSPLNPILGWAKLLQTRPLDPKQTKFALETIERNAKLQTQLIEDLLDVSRILRGKVVLDTAAVNLVPTIESALETVRLAAEAKGIQIQKVLHPDVGMVLGDAARLQQVIWNLLSNAVKFTPADGRVEVQLEKVIGHGKSVMGQESSPIPHSLFPIPEYAQITVIDTGKGISADFLPYIFDYFRQEDGTTTRKFGGLGLGLAIVRYLVELHGGTVWAESAGEGQGATFIVQLPLMAMPSAASEQKHPMPLAHLTGFTILVVDDDPDVRDVVAFILEQAGATVSLAASALAALNQIEQSPPDLLICDVGMPEMDGYMLMRQIRARSTAQGGKIPAIALTAYAGDSDQQQALAAGFQQHLAKPIEPEVLVQAIAALLANTPHPSHSTA